MAKIAIHYPQNHHESIKIFNFDKICDALKDDGHDLYFIDKNETPEPSELINELEKQDLLLTSDTGVMHIGDGIIPIIACFGPTSAIKNRPISSKAIVIYRELLCRPCYSYGKIHCDNDTQYECMNIAWHIIYSAVNKMLFEQISYDYWFIRDHDILILESKKPVELKKEKNGAPNV